MSNPPENILKYGDTVTIFPKPERKVDDPKMTFDPTCVEITSVTQPKDHFI